MGLLITIPDADFSALGNPQVDVYIEGLPSKNLAALHLFKTGTTGAAYAGPATDYSGNVRNATLATNSTCLKSAAGVANVASSGSAGNNGFGFLSPLAISPKFTVFGITKNLYPPASALQVFSLPWLSSGNTNSASAPNVSGASFGSVNVGTDGILEVNEYLNATADSVNIAAFNVKTNNSNSWDGTTTTRAAINKGTPPLGGPKNSWLAWALSFDAQSGVVLNAMGSAAARTSDVGGSAQVAANLWATQQISRGAKHLFGWMNYNLGADKVKGEMAMFGVYDGVAMSTTEAAALLASMKVAPAIVARGLTVL